VRVSFEVGPGGGEVKSSAPMGEGEPVDDPV
jgi:hypothetical protein